MTTTKSSPRSRRYDRFAAKVSVSNADGFDALLDIMETLPPGPRRIRYKSMHPDQVAFRKAYQEKYDANMARIREDRELAAQEARDEQAARDLAREHRERAQAIERERVEKAEAYFQEMAEYMEALDALNAEVA